MRREGGVRREGGRPGSEGGSERGREGGRQGVREGVRREGGSERGREGGREGRRELGHNFHCKLYSGPARLALLGQNVQYIKSQVKLKAARNGSSFL